jgi:enoyl-CoA hydratase/carnithine racemase
LRISGKFAANFTKLGFHPGFGLTFTLPRLIGVQHAADMFLTGRRVKAEEALAWGLIDQLVAADKLMATASALAAEIAANGPLAVRSTRQTLRAGLAEGVKAATDVEFIEQRWLMKTEDFKEGVKSVAERRPGNFKGK